MSHTETAHCPNCGRQADDDTSIRQLAAGSHFECERCGFKLDPWAESRFRY